MKFLSRSMLMFAMQFGVALFLAGPASADPNDLVTLCYRARTIHVASDLRAKYVAQGASDGACPVGNGAPVFTTNPQSATSYKGGSVTFTASATGTPTPTYQWYFNEDLIPGAIFQNLTKSNLQSGNAGAYKVVATNSAGWETSTVAQLTVLDNVVTTNADIGPGSLRDVIANAPDNISIGFAGSFRRQFFHHGYHHLRRHRGMAIL
ncbi:MAG: immunoglobulin domain-containing protein [Luteolibacter sp.]